MKQQIFILLILFGVIYQVSSAQTPISGEISGVWPATGNPYLIEGDCWVSASDTLVVQSSVEMFFMDSFEFRIEGICFFEGSDLDSIFVFNGTTTSGHFSIEAGEADWRYTSLSGGVDEILVQSGELTIGHSLFHNDAPVLITAAASTINLSNSVVAIDESFPEEYYFIDITGGELMLSNLDYWSNSRGLVDSDHCDLVIQDCDIDFNKDDWFDCSHLIYANGGSYWIQQNEMTYTMNASDEANSGTIIKLELLPEGTMAYNDMEGIVQVEGSTDSGSLVAVYGGQGRITNTDIIIHPENPASIEEAEMILKGIEYFAGDIDSCTIHVASGESVNLSTSIAGISACSGSIFRNLIITEGSVWSHCITACDADILNNTIHSSGEDLIANSHFAVSYCNGTLKNNILFGLGTALDPPQTLDHTYNCYWEFGDTPNIPILETGEFYADPALDSTYHLPALSPCINTGDPTSPYDPDSTIADMGAYYKDQSDRARIVDWGPQDFTSAPEHTSQTFWISAIDPAGTGLNYLWIYRGETVGTDSLVEIAFQNAGQDSLIAFVFNTVGSDSQRWHFDLTAVNTNIYVPEDFSTIQEALDYASYSGDTIRIAPGTYVENLEMIDKTVVMLGSEPGEVIIDGGSTGSVLHMENCVPDSVILKNLIFQNGLSETGGGICADAAVLRIENCMIRDNQVVSQANGYGGGIYFNIGGLRLTNTIIEENTLQGNGYVRGGGLFCNGILAMQNCQVKDNEILTGGTVVTGGGIHYTGGGGEIEETIIRGNRIDDADFLLGAGIRCSNADLFYCEITDNSVGDGTTRKGGGIYAVHSDIENCSVALNEAEEGAGIYIQLTGSTTVHNCIVALNEGNNQVSSANSDITHISYSDIYQALGEPFGNCFPSEGCVFVDPQFVDGDPFDVHLTEDSPCINAGDPASPPDPDGTRADMGCYYFEISGLKDPADVTKPLEFALHSPYPNPFNPNAMICYQLPVGSLVKLTAYDVSGRLVEELVNGWRAAGIHEITFEATDYPSGVYFVKFDAGDYHSVRKLLLIK